MATNRLLIVDDEPAIGAFIGRIAANAGYEILAVSTVDKFLDHVRAWRPTHIMLDRAFVVDCARSGESRSIVRMIIDLAHALGMTTVAEGVEDMAALELLRALGCDAAQGYFIAKPAGGDALPELARTLQDAGWARALRAKRAIQRA